MTPSNCTMDAVPADLRELVERAISEARRQLTNRGGMDPLFLVRMPNGKIQKADLPEPLNEVMNSGEGKSALFGFVRRYVQRWGCTAVVFLTDAYLGVPTEKHIQMARENPEELHRIVNETGFDLSEAVRLGLCERQEALMVNVQTATDVVLIGQPYTRYDEERRIEFGQRTVNRFPQDEFRGRQKMYGVKTSADII